jgi:uncharacterized membrane protein
MSNNSITAKRLGTRQITIIGMLSAISILLGSTGFGFVPLPMAKATIMQIPVIIGAILEGPIVGICVGLIFGLFSIFQNITNPNVLSFAFLNPLVSVLPRMLIGIVAYYTYKMPFIKNQLVKIGFSAVLGSLTNTFGVLTMIYFIYAAQYAAAKGIAIDTAAKVIYGIALTNGVPEAIIAVIVTIPAVTAVKKVLKR